MRIPEGARRLESKEGASLILATIGAVIAPVIVVEHSGLIAAFGRSRELRRRRPRGSAADFDPTLVWTKSDRRAVAR